jgi:hypothetical protein
MIRYILIIILLIPSLTFLAQTEATKEDVNPKLKIKGEIIEEDIGVNNVTITLKGLDSSFVIKTTANGKYEFPEKVAKGIYTIAFEKKGYISKTVLIDLTITDSPIIDDLSILVLSPSMVKKEKWWGYGKIEKNFYAARIHITSYGSIEVDSKYTNKQVSSFNLFIKKKHH